MTDMTKVLNYDDGLPPSTLSAPQGHVLAARSRLAPQTELHWSVSGSVDLSGCTEIRTITGTMSVGGDLDLSSCKRLSKINLSGSVGGDLDLRGTKVTRLSGLIVRGRVLWPDRGELVTSAGRAGVVGLANRYAGTLIGASLMRCAWRGSKGWMRRMRECPAAREESFSQACARLRLTESCLASRARQLAVQFWICSMVVAAIIVGMAVSLPSADIFSMINTLVMLSVLSAFVLMAAQNSFRVWQIRNRTLGGLKEWLRSPKYWIP